MSKHYFVTSEVVQPSARWREAFPTGIACDLASTIKGARALMIKRGEGQVEDADTIWLATSHNYWPQLLASLNRSVPRCPVVVVSANTSEGEGLLALQSGARGYCNLHSVPEMFENVAQSVQFGGMWVGPDLLARVMAATREALPPPKGDLTDSLSVREAEVAKTVAEGHSNKEVARILGITERTVKAHLGAVFEKLGVRDRLHLVLKLSEGSQAGGARAR